MTPLIRTYPINKKGRDFLACDVHGCFDKLRAALDERNFDEAVDRLFLGGDMVDRGSQSAEVLDWIDKPWCFASIGNHEQMAIDVYERRMHSMEYSKEGGKWFLWLEPSRQKLYVDAFKDLPHAMEVETKNGLVGIVHAEVPWDDWYVFSAHLRARTISSHTLYMCLWNRNKITNMDPEPIEGIYKVYLGHTPLKGGPVTLGNAHYIDTGACYGRELTVVQIN